MSTGTAAGSRSRGYVHERRERLREMFVPLRHDPGHAQVDFGEAFAVIAGQECKIHFYAISAAQRCLLGAGLSGGEHRGLL